MVAKKLSPVPAAGNDFPFPTGPGTPEQGPTTTTLPPLVPVRPQTSSSTKTSGYSNKDREKAETLRKIREKYDKSFFDVGNNKFTGGLKQVTKNVKTEYSALSKMARTAPADMAHFFGGIAVDAYRAFDPRMLYDANYRDYFINEYAGNSTLYNAAVSFKDTLQFWDVIPEYIDTLESGQAITPLLVRDAGNLSIVAGGLAKGFKGAAVKNTIKATAAESAAAAGTFADEAAAAASTRYINRMKRTASAMEKAGNFSGRVFYYSNEVGMVPFKPWIWTGSKLGAAKRNGIYVEGLGGWGAKAAESYKQQISDLRAAEPDISPNDPRLKDLQTKLSRNLRMSLTHSTKAQIRQAVRNQQHESELIKKTLLNIQKSPKYIDDINEATGEKWGELSQAENEAVIAVLNGRANLIAWMVENLEMSPEEISVLGRYDASPEFYLSEAGSRMAYDMLTGNMDNVQYERLADAVFRIGRVITDVTQRAVEGYGRRTALSPDYLKPIPFWNKLRAAVMASGNKKLIEMVDNFDELFQQVESGETPMTQDQYNNLVKLRDEISVVIVEQLPDELALDPDMYPANMRENVEFFRRVRRSWNQDLIANAEGEPLPPRDGGPRSPETPWFPFEGEAPVREGGFAMPRGRGKLTASTDMIKRLRDNAAKLREKIIEITDRIAKLEEKYVLLIQRLRRYDVVEAYIAGKTTKEIAKKFRISVAEVEKILSNNALRRAYDNMKAIEAEVAELQKVIGVKRSRLRGPEAQAELVALQEQLDVLIGEAKAAQQALTAARNINEIARQADESQADKLAEEQDKLEDELFDNERDFENSGGDIESLHEKVDPADTTVFPVTIDAAFQMVLALQFMADNIDSVLRSNGAANVADAVSRVVKTLELTLNDAETLLTEASSPSRSRLADLRIQQIGGLLVDLSTKINELQVDPPDGVLLEQAIADQILAIVDEPQNQQILAGTAPLTAEPVKPRTGPSTATTPAGQLYEDFYNEGLAEDGGVNYSVWVNNIKNIDLEQIEFIAEVFSSPEKYADVQGATVLGNINYLMTTANILARWINEVAREKSTAKQIELILNPPDYVPEALAKKLLHGVTRDKARLAKLSVTDTTHPVSKFMSKVVREALSNVLEDINNFAFAYHKFGSLRFADWKKIPEAKLINDWSGNPRIIQIYPTSIPADGVVPRIRFDISTPVESVLEAIDALIYSIEQDKGAQGLYVSELLESMYGYGDPAAITSFVVEIDGLTKKNAKYKAQALKELQQLRAKIESAKNITPEQLAESIVDPKRLPGVTTRPIERKLTPVKTVVPENIAPDSPGKNPLPDNLEEIALRAANDELYYEELVDLSQDAARLEAAIESIKNPTPEELAKYKEEKLKEADQEIYDLNGLALTNLAGGIHSQGIINTSDARWYVKVDPEGTPEWDWWYNLDGRMRQRLARTYFVSTPIRVPGSKRIIRKAQGIDAIADQAGMTIDEWADAFLEHDRVLNNAKKRRKELKSLDKQELRDDFIAKETYDIQGYIDKYEETGITAEQYQQILDRIDFLKAEDTGNVPSNLRPIAKSPDEVVPDPAIADPTVRAAAYEVDVVDAMAKDAANKMRRAQKMTERVKAFNEFVTKAESYDEAVARFEKMRGGREKTLTAISINEEKQRVLREKMKAAKKLERRLSKTEKMMVESPQLQKIEKMRGGIPLQVALEGGYPAEQFAVDVPTPEGGLETVPIVGPMYLPTGRPRGFTGALKVEQLKRGLEGFQTLSSEHYRDGDRHTIFSIRQLALRLGNEMSQITGNEAYKAIVAQFGNEAVAILGEELSLSLYEKAYEKVASMPLAEQIRLGYTGIIEEQSIGPDGSIPDAESIARIVDDGIASYSQGVVDPAAAFNLALKEEFGRLIAQEMAFQGYTAVDPFKSIGAALAYTKVTHKSMFLPTGLRELIAQTQVVSDPSTWNRAIKAAAKVTGAMKTSTLVFSVTWQLGDLISNVMIAAMSGQDVSVRDLIRRMRDVKRKEYGPGFRGLLDPRFEDFPTPTPDITIAQEAPIQDIGASQAERRYIYGIPDTPEKPPLLTRIFKKQYPEVVRGRGVAKFSFRVNEAINRISRHAYFLELLENELAKRGLTIDEISDTWRSDSQLRKLVFDVAETANDFLGDFADLELWERKLVAVGVPFYSWQKHIHKVFMLLGRESPESLRWYFYLGAINFDPDEDPMNLRYGGLSLFGGVVSTNIFNPLGDVVGGPIPSAVFEGDVRPILNTLGPVPRLTTASALGLDVTKLQPVSRPAGTGSYTPSGQLMATPLITRPGELAGFSMQQFPIIPRLLNILPEGTLPGTNIATGPVSRYGTGEARLRPGGQTLRRPGGQLAALGRLFSLPGIPYQSEDQLLNIEASARQRLRTINALRRRRAAQTGEEYVPVGE